jgi:exonuclease VII small subunit
MNAGELRSAALRLSVGDRLRLIWDLVRSLLGWQRAIESAVPAEPSLEQAIARIESLLDQILLDTDLAPLVDRSTLLQHLTALLATDQDLCQTVLQQSTESLTKAIADIATAKAAAAELTQRCTAEELAELAEIGTD